MSSRATGVPQYGDPEWSGPARPRVFQLVRHPQPELGTLGDLDPDPEDLLAAIDIDPDGKVAAVWRTTPSVRTLQTIASQSCSASTRRGWPVTPSAPALHADLGVLAEPGRGVLLDHHPVGTARGNFPAVADLIAAMERFLDAWNDRCQPSPGPRTTTRSSPRPPTRDSNDVRYAADSQHWGLWPRPQEGLSYLIA